MAEPESSTTQEENTTLTDPAGPPTPESSTTQEENTVSIDPAGPPTPLQRSRAPQLGEAARRGGRPAKPPPRAGSQEPVQRSPAAASAPRLILRRIGLGAVVDRSGWCGGGGGCSPRHRAEAGEHDGAHWMLPQPSGRPRPREHGLGCTSGKSALAPSASPTHRAACR